MFAFTCFKIPERDIIYLERDIIYLERDIIYLERDIIYLERDIIYLERDIIYLERDINKYYLASLIIPKLRACSMHNKTSLRSMCFEKCIIDPWCTLYTIYTYSQTYNFDNFIQHPIHIVLYVFLFYTSIVSACG